MKKMVFLASMLALLVMVSPASAAVVLDFSDGGAPSPTGNCTLTATTAVCNNIAIASLKVSGDGVANGTYFVDGTVGGYGSMSFSVSTTAPATDTLTIVGSVDCQNAIGTSGTGLPGGHCTTADDTGHFNLVPTGTTLLSESGAISGLTISGVGTATATVSFGSGGTPDTKAQTLLAALGITNQLACSAGQCPGWTMGGFSIATQDVTGGTYTATSVDIPDTQVPEPASMLLLGTILVGVTRVVRRRVKA